jgi:hypothetical protein
MPKGNTVIDRDRASINIIKSLEKELLETQYKYSVLLRKHILMMEKCINLLGFLPSTEENDDA